MVLEVEIYMKGVDFPTPYGPGEQESFSTGDLHIH